MHCSDLKQRTHAGWAICMGILIIFILPDGIDSIFIYYYSSLHGHMKGIFAGLILMSVSTISILATIIFINASSSSNAELLMNSVAILFLNDIDEQVYSIISRLKPSWIELLEEEITNEENNVNTDTPDVRIDLSIERFNCIQQKCLNADLLSDDNIFEDFSTLFSHATNLNDRVRDLNDEKNVLQQKVQTLEDESLRMQKDLQILKSFLGIEVNDRKQ